MSPRASGAPSLRPARSPRRRWLSWRRARRRADDALLHGPLGGELLGTEALADRAREVARSQRWGPRYDSRTPLLERLDATRGVLAAAHGRIAEASSKGDVGPAGEWLLDNFYVIQDHTAQVRQSLPRGYYRELPVLLDGPLAGFPRVYQVATALISHTEARVDLETLDRFVSAFQEVAPLDIGELWALPAMLRLALVESVRRMTLRTVKQLDARAAADGWAERLRRAESTGPTALAMTTAELSESIGVPAPDFVARLHEQLRRSESPAALESVEHWLEDEGHSVEEATGRVTQRLAISQVTMSNSITSLRTVGALDWNDFVESQSLLEAVLRDDPAAVYPRMTFETRDRYRHVVERLARRTRTEETAVARRAIALAASAPGESVMHHVGWFLVDAGRPALEREIGYRPPLGTRLRRAVRRSPGLALGVAMTTGTGAALALLFWLAGPAAWQQWPVVVLLALLPAQELTVQALQLLVSQFLPPRRLPKLDFVEQSGIPRELETAVVVPTLFGSVAAVERTLEHLEAQFLANRGPHLKFVVLSDFTDAPTEHRESDVEIVAAAVAGMQALEARYGDGRRNLFYLLHRARQWNPRQGVWMGWERKRGKLSQFNHLVLGRDEEAFAVTVGELTALRAVRFVITLDADTVLPPTSAAALVGAMAHPLNHPVYDPGRSRVTQGYGILQPRVGVSLPSANRSRFASIFSGEPGVDPYTTAVSDVYQDLYDEGSFTGKGIYEVEAFERATHRRFPDNALLSHDLIEGTFARAGLVTDIQVFDDFPSRYLTWTQRKHRWIRGDWQLLRWVLPRVPSAEGEGSNPLSLLSRWKVLDNLRRSLLEPAQLAFLVAGWTILPGSPLRWTALGLAAIAAPWILTTVLALVRPPLDRSWRAYYLGVVQEAMVSARQALYTVAFLPHQAWNSLDAIVRTLWRLGVSKRRLLEWRTASQAERSQEGSTGDLWRSMWPTVVGAAALFGWLVFRTLHEPRLAVLRPVDRAALLLGCGFLAALWVVAPWLAAYLNEPPVRSERRLSPRLRSAALRYALLHWSFFERFVTERTHWLAPDNFQESPAPVVAMRTSPTNIGLQLLATVSAHDLGFIDLEETATRLERVFDTLARLRRFRGHFYNWYDLDTLEDLAPGYISTVDSGNLAGHLIALRQACLAVPDAPVFDRRTWAAVDAALGLCQESLPKARHPAELTAARTLLATAPQQLEVGETLANLENLLERVAPVTPSGPMTTDWLGWTRRLVAAARQRVAGLEPIAVPGRTGSLMPRLPSLRQVAERSESVRALLLRLERIAERCDALVEEMDFSFLYDKQRSLFAIGYQLTTHALDSSHYDLLASEARLASFVAIAKNDVPVEHWFHLGRELSRAAGQTALMSWGGTMFEYLMPALVMRSFPFTLLDQTYRSSVERQIAFASWRSVPWGISESAYNLRDHAQTYQYRSFGVPDLALKRGLDADLVVAPYASLLAAMVVPAQALANLRQLERLGALGAYGFRDALDFTRPTPGRPYAVVETFMAHHIGMSLVALTNALSAGRWQRTFHDDPLVRSAELLLYERIPRRVVFQETQVARAEASLPDPELERPAVRRFDTASTPQPRVALLGRLPYTIMVTNAGSGYSRYGSLAVTRWRADGTADASGQFCYLKDLGTGRVWSSAFQPTAAEPDSYQAALATDRVIFHRVDGAFETRTEVTVVPDDSAEVRRVTVTNNGSRPGEVELTSYGEWVLAPPDADRAHPAFGNLFVETEWHAWCQALTARRRPRSKDEPYLWGVHVVALPEAAVGGVSFETDRARFLGRGRSVRGPAALDPGAALSGTTGAVLDPIFSLRTRLRLGPGQSASMAFTTAVATSPEGAFDLADRYRDPHAAQRALDLAWTTAQIELRELGTSSEQAALYQKLASDLFFSDPQLRAPEAELRRNRGSQALLWNLGLSGDWPIVLAMLDSADGLPTLEELLKAHHYWRRRGMTVDLVVLNTHPPTYWQTLTDRIGAAVRASSEASVQEQPGGVFIRRRELLRPEELAMLRSTARVHVPCDGRRLAQIADRSAFLEERDPEETATSPRGPLHRLEAGLGDRLRVPAQAPPPPATAEPSPPPRPAPLESAPIPIAPGVLGDDGSYRIALVGQTLPPMPWSNVIANEAGGLLVSERGGGFSWASSSFFYRLTPWHNDPVSDPVSDVLYLRDLESGEAWTPTPGPIDDGGQTEVRHGQGSSTFEHRHGELRSVLTLGLAEGAAVKVSRLRLWNDGTRRRRLSVTAYVEWTLGAEREHTQHQICTDFDAARGTLFARNTFDPQFSEWAAFCTMVPGPERHGADRREFLGRNGSVAAPRGLADPPSGRTGAALDPCAVLQRRVDLGPGESTELVVFLGAAASRTAADALVDTLRSSGRSPVEQQTVARWEERLSGLRVKTPEPTLDALLNRWLLYQTLSCRMWARSALYQSGGAYGFRDQLQDSMALLYAEPGLVRAHLLRAAGRQFVEGDVQHWWHPQSGRGMRTRISDDMVWLPAAVDRYLEVTADAPVLEERIPFLTMRLLAPDEHEAYDLPSRSAEEGTLYEHCRRALRRAATHGVHGLPLIGEGDWNDGMNRVGVEGKGESVWLGWFLVKTLRDFARRAEARGDAAEAVWMRTTADGYLEALETHGWDGAWYRRAFFDDGTPLGSAASEECRIDSIAQSWSVLSGAGRPDRARQAMESLRQLLVDPSARLMKLLAPPFDRAPQDPGYIRGYLPGVRENGAQYTHAALWAVRAMAELGDAALAFEHFQMLNPFTHTRTPEEVAVYQAEPYVVAADVYTAPGHLGRGGWSWYTGSAAWMYRVGLESILGFRKEGQRLRIVPCVPDSWARYEITYRFGTSTYRIAVEQRPGERPGTVWVDDQVQADGAIPLIDDGRSHAVVVLR